MSLKISEDSIFYIVAPACSHTGGPKDLHQLGHELRNLGKEVYMYYFPIEDKDPVHENYKIYDIPYTKKIADNKKNVLIFGETSSNIQISKQFYHIQKVLWWLSLDYFFITFFNNRFPKLLRSLIKLPLNLIKFFHICTNNYFGNLSYAKYLKIIYLKFSFKNVLNIKGINLNLSQSIYQKEILESKNIKSKLLCDYITDEFFEAAKNISLNDKKNIVCYNPVKSSSFMNKIIKKNPFIKFVPLKNFTTKELIKILSVSKIYMDFGFHPGVDHLPREAAILKNCILTNKEGSAFYHEAVPIDEEFKYQEKRNNLLIISNKIVKIFNNFDSELVFFENYRNKIYQEKKIFENQVRDLFK